MFHFVTRGDPTVGWGHASRTLALAEWCEKTGRDHEVISHSPELAEWPWPKGIVHPDEADADPLADGGLVIGDGLNLPCDPIPVGIRVRQMATIVDDGDHGSTLSVNPNFGA